MIPPRTTTAVPTEPIRNHLALLLVQWRILILPNASHGECLSFASSCETLSHPVCFKEFSHLYIAKLCFLCIFTWYKIRFGLACIAGRALVHPLQVGYITQVLQMHISDKPNALVAAYDLLRKYCNFCVCTLYLYMYILTYNFACTIYLIYYLNFFLTGELSDSFTQWLQLDVLHAQAVRLLSERFELVRTASNSPNFTIDEYTPAARLVISYWRLHFERILFNTRSY